MQFKLPNNILKCTIFVIILAQVSRLLYYVRVGEDAVYLPRSSRQLLEETGMTEGNSSTMALTTDSALTTASPTLPPPHVVYRDTQPLSDAMKRSIFKWMEQSGAPCVSKNDINQCPCIPPGLKGSMSLNLTLAMNYTWKQVADIAWSPRMEPGGVWSPGECVSRRRVLIVIPFRDREPHLRALLAHMHPILQRQLLTYRIVVVEQRLPQIFNKAAMMNIGYKEAERRGFGPFDCVLLQDVDVLMEDDRNLIICGEHLIHYGVFLDRHNYKRCCAAWLGAVFSMKWKQFALINGYSNKFFGWGGEDDNIYYRMKKKHIKKSIPLESIGRYSIIEHARDAKNAPNKHNEKLAFAPVDMSEGLSSINYTVVEMKEFDLYTWILADLSVQGLPYPNVSTSWMYSQTPGSCDQGETLSTLVVTSSSRQCEDSCGHNVNCSGFVVYTNTQGDMVCVLKAGSCGLQTNLSSNYTTYLKGVDLELKSEGVKYAAYTVDCRGNDLKYFKSKSPSDCASRCNTIATCKGLVYITKSSMCYLKHTCKPSMYRLDEARHKTYVRLN